MEAVITTVGGAILSASFQALFDKLGSDEVLRFACEGDIEDELKKWDAMLKKIYLVLDDAEEKKMANPLVKMWVSELRDLAYDIEDVLDEFATDQALRRKPGNDEPVPTADTSKVRKFIPSCCAKLSFKTLKSNAEMIRKITIITQRLDEIVKQKDGLLLGEAGRGRSNQIRERPPTTSLVNEAQIYGREKDKMAVIQMLNAPINDAKPSVIPVVGLGGVGKTTLAQIIFNDTSLDFDFKSWVSVGEDFDVLRMTKTILQSDGGDDKDLNSVQLKLKEKLYLKKFLIVLDDVWNQNYEYWTQLCAPFILGAQGSTLIITTRSQDVASMVGTSLAFDLKVLSDDACLSIFAQHALGATNFNDHMDLKEVGEGIARRCDGLPLAAKALGGLLRGKPDPKLWMNVLRSEIWDFPNDKINILPALQLSYFHLPPHLKQCFAYCAVFPKDYEFDVNELILLWMAEGFLCDLKKMDQMEEVGSKYFDDLLARSFFQKSSSSESRYVMHDLMNDLARHVSAEICFQLGDKLEEEMLFTKIRHSSFIRHEFDTWQKFDIFLKMRRLRSFLAMPIMKTSSWRPCHLTGKIMNELVPGLKRLRVLSLASYCFEELPVSIGALKLLRYLNLSYTEIRRLPESVANLINLQTFILCGCGELTELPSGIGNLINLYYLDISGCYKLVKLPSGVGNLINLHCLDISSCNGLVELPFSIGNLVNLHFLDISRCYKLTKLPSGISKLTNLQCLDISDTYNLQEMPQQIGNLKNLQILTKFIVGKNDGLKLTELKKLSKLRWRLCIKELQNVVDLQDAEYADIKEKPGIQELQLEWAGRDYGTSSNPREDDVGVLNLLRPPHQNLSNLSIIGFGGSELPSWLGDPTFTDMVQLHLSCCTKVMSLPPLEHLPSLETLRITGLKEWEQWKCISYDLSKEAAALGFPKLHHLSISSCPKLIGKLPGCLSFLQKLSIEGCQEALLKSMSQFTSLTILEITGISRLVSLDETQVQDLVALQDLKIISCSELVYLWKDETNLDKLASLKSLAVKQCYQILSLVEGEEGKLPCNLQVLRIEHCFNLQKLANGLHRLTCLKDLTTYHCDKLKLFPAKGVPYSLKHLQIEDCISLESVPDGVIASNDNPESQLEELKIKGCPSLKLSLSGHFPDSLKTLWIIDCDWLETLRLTSHEGISHLIELNISRCPQLQWYQETGLALHTLTSLCVQNCEKFRALPDGMQKLMALQFLEISDCGGLVSFPHGGLPPNLTDFRITNCKNLRQPLSEWGLLTLSSLTKFTVGGTIPGSEILYSFSGDNGQLILPTSLTHLDISNFKNLKSVSSALQNLTSLLSLSISSCPKLKSLPEEHFPPTLGRLRIRGCPCLKEWCIKLRRDHQSVISHIPSVVIDQRNC